MKSTVRRRSSSSRTFILLILLGICLVSVLTYTVTFAHGWNDWGNHGFPWWTAGHGQNCGSGVTQVCNPYRNAWQTCTSTTDQSTPVQSQGSTTPTSGRSDWQIWHNCSGTPGQNGGTPPTNGGPCITYQPTITQVSTPVDPSQLPASTATPCASPTIPAPIPTTVLTSTPTTIAQPTIPSSTPPTVSTPVSGSDPVAQAVFAQINQERAGAGLPALQWSNQLQQSAHNHNVALVQSGLPISEIFPQSGDGYAHQLPGEPPLGDRITNVGLHWTSAAENVGFSSGGDPTNAATGLNTSMFNEQPPDDGHRQNILSGNTLIGVDVYVDNQNRIWLTEDFAKPM
jgi:uncharacterized protein YkwD